MGFWNFFKKNRETPPVEEDVYIKKDEETSGKTMGIHKIYSILERDYEQKGYEDALVNPDTVQMNKGIVIIKDDLLRTIDQVKIYYQDFLREIDFHIESRKANAMTTTVDELIMKKEKAQTHYTRVLEIEKESLNGSFESKSVFLTYKRGFERGLAAISFTEIQKYNH